jgi:hypothetical protein
MNVDIRLGLAKRKVLDFNRLIDPPFFFVQIHVNITPREQKVVPISQILMLSRNCGLDHHPSWCCGDIGRLCTVSSASFFCKMPLIV